MKAAANWSYLGTVLGVAVTLIHMAYGQWKYGKWPPIIRLLGTFLAGAGTMSGFQLGSIVLSPPTLPPTTIAVDDHRVTLGIGVFALFAACFWALVDNWRAMEQPVAGLKTDREREIETTMERKCSGGPTRGRWCGRRAIVVCTAADGLKWFACEDLEHREGSDVEPIEDWFRRLFPPKPN